MNNNRSKYIDALKGWAILGTVIVHCGLWGDGYFATLANAGARMCQLFFVISAYLMFGSYDVFCKAYGDVVTIKNSTTWILKRFVRLMPLWYLSLLVHLVLRDGGSSYWLGTQKCISLINMVSHLLFIHGLFPYYMNSIIGVEWYIGDIVILIILMPILYKLMKSFDYIVIGILGTNVLLHFVEPLLLNHSILNIDDGYIWNTYITDFGFWNQFPVMLIGIALYKLTKEIELDHTISNKNVVSIILIITSYIVQYGLIFKNSNIWMISKLTFWGIAFAFMFLGLYLHSYAIIDNSVMRMLGRYSYPIYLFHFRIVIWYYNICAINTGIAQVDAVLRIIIVIIISLLLGIIVTKFVEKPCIRLLDNIFHYSRF